MGRIFKCTIPARLSQLAAVLFLCASLWGHPLWVNPVWAQQGNPEVYIDMGALPPAGSAPQGSTLAPIKLKPPTPRPAQEQGQGSGFRLTAPEPAPVAPAPQIAPQATPQATPPPVNTKPAPSVKPAVASPAKPVSKPVSNPAPKPAPAKPAPVKAPESRAADKVVKPSYVSKPPSLPQDNLPQQKPQPMPTAMPPAVTLPVVPADPPLVEEPVPLPTSFPVETRIRKETSDPAVSDSSRPVPLRSGTSGPVDDDIPSRPAPDLDPEGAVQPEPEAKPTPAEDAKRVKAEEKKSSVVRAPYAPLKKPAAATKEAAPVTATVAPITPAAKPEAPLALDASVKEEVKPDIAVAATAPYIPPRRPSLVEKAPAELVAALRAREAGKEAAMIASASTAPPEPKRAINLTDPPPPPGPRGAKNMPAVKKPAVEAEVLTEQMVKLPAGNDPLLDRLVEKDKDSLVATIESMVAAREDGKPLPKAEKVKRELGTNIVKAEPMQRPYNVYRPKKNEAADTAPPVPAVLEEITPLPAPEIAQAPEPEPAQEAKTAAITPRPPPPRDQDEQAYVSVPFREGLTDVDASISSEIEKRVLPVLNANPAWKLQIQAFASPVKDGASSARKASLARALAVRTYLLGKGIDATRMDVRALGAESDRDPVDRVDLIVFDPAKRG